MKNFSVEQNHIENLSKKREEYVAQRDVFLEEKGEWKEGEDYTFEFDPSIDDLGNQILDCIKNWRYALPVEFILEELVKLGWAPCLLNDDAGHFAIVSDGMQNIPDPEVKIDIQLEFCVQKDKWHDSIRDALNYFLDND